MLLCTLTVCDGNDGDDEDDDDDDDGDHGDDARSLNRLTGDMIDNRYSIFHIKK